MEQNRTGSLIAIIVALILIVGAGFYFYAKSHPYLPEVTSELQSFSAEKPNFLATGSNLSQVTVVAIPTGTSVSESDYVIIGDMVETASSTEMNQLWTLPIPTEPVLASEIYAEGFDPQGESVGKISLEEKGATDIYSSLWNNDEERSFTLKIGEKATYKDFTLQLLRINSDSRCPTDVRCIQAGDVSVNVGLTSGGKTETKTLTESGNPNQYKNYYIEVTKVSPERVSTQTLTAADYSVTFTISTDLKG